MFRSFFHSKEWALWAWGGLAIILTGIYVDVEIAVLFNTWYGEFYNILQTPAQYTLNDFYGKLQWFAILAFLAISIGVGLRWFINHWTLRWRQAMTMNFVTRWKNVDANIEGSSQRIQEDCMRFARLLESLGENAVKSLITLIAFIPILWAISENVVVPYMEGVQGSLVWIAMVIGLGGIVVSWYVGIKLPGLEYNNQKVEAAFRKQLVFAEDYRYREELSLAHVVELFTGIKFNYSRLYLHYTYFNVWRIFYYQANIILPYVVIGPSIMTGAVTLGVLVQASNAFRKVHEAVTFLIDRWTDVTEMRSIWKRVGEFQLMVDSARVRVRA